MLLKSIHIIKEKIKHEKILFLTKYLITRLADLFATFRFIFVVLFEVAIMFCMADET